MIRFVKEKNQPYRFEPILTDISPDIDLFPLDFLLNKLGLGSTFDLCYAIITNLRLQNIY